MPATYTDSGEPSHRSHSCRSPPPPTGQSTPPPHHYHHSQSSHSSQSQSRHERNDSKPENRLGQYNIIKTLGEGSFGKVKLAVHQVSGQKVALKIISRKKLVNRDMAGRVEREIAYLQLLRHPHIIKLYTVITTPTEIIMVIEYAGNELFDYIVQNGKMTEDNARRFFQQIICAVEYCHRHKIVHRDLKPENLLLDEFLNVKIADFGLSNIMTDGNFLKTSCGSPNYAAPEVISGKLYAGPEVDVWSCGVILYVLLCGRLPFDDDYIPTLFKKISQGNYTIPHYLGPEARNLISKMLVVNPLHRITVAEIRQDPWFNKNLPDYLLPPKEEFFDTGVDFSKLPPLKAIERSPAEKLKGELHDVVVGKLGKTMGYAKDDVQDALNKEEPSAIKDAYMIVRENQMMIRDSRLSNAHNIQSFLAQSPPAWNSYMPSSPSTFQQSSSSSSSRPSSAHPSSSFAHTNTPSRTASPLTLPAKDQLSISGVPENLATPGDPGRSPNSSISVLPSSLPEYHRAFMTGGPAKSKAKEPEAPVIGKRGLKPINTRLQPSANRLEALTPITQSREAKRPKQTRWQFGIRSRNAPLEAVGCIYRALKKLGAEWVVDEVGEEDGYSSEEEFVEDAEGEKAVPEDPWVIHCRWKKVREGESRGKDAEEEGKGWVWVHMEIQLYQLEMGFYLVDFKCKGYEPESGFEDDVTGEKVRKKVVFEDTLGGDEEGKVVEGRVEEGGDVAEVKEVGKEEGAGKEREKDVCSPFPFLDLACKLIMQLAE
ncbi:Protein kinase [Rhizina undulata]